MKNGYQARLVDAAQVFYVRKNSGNVEFDNHHLFLERLVNVWNQ